MTSLNPVFTVGNQIGEAIRLHQELGKKETRAKTIEMLRLVKIADPDSRVDSYPHQLSGGMAQRVMISMALSCNPSLLIADEPTTALDATTQSLILRELRELMSKFNLTLILITHDVGIAAETCKKLAVMYLGEIVEFGDLWDVLENPAHPYTEGLIRAMPTLKQKVLKTIEGTVPSPYDYPGGCRFHPRCPYVMGRCKVESPAMI